MFLQKLINKFFGTHAEVTGVSRETSTPPPTQPESYERLRSELSQTNLRLAATCAKAHRLEQAADAKRTRLPQLPEASHA